MFLRDQQLLGHVIDQQRAHAVVGELLPHVGEEQDREPARLAEPVAKARPRRSCSEPSDPQTSSAHQMVPSRYVARGLAILGEEDRSVEIDDIAMLPDDECRRHGETGADHVADHHAEAEPPRLVAPSASASVRPPHLSSLMLMTSKRPTSPGNVVEPESAFVGSDRDWAAIAVEIGFGAARQSGCSSSETR